jgi:hypothetical protein
MSQSTRLFAETYSATRQRQAASSDPKRWQDEILGRMRLDLISFQTLVVPDTHFFDGRFFLETGPNILGEELRRSKYSTSIPVEVRHRSSTLTDSLAQLLVREESLNGFPFNSIQDEGKRSALAHAIKERTVAELRSSIAKSESVWDGVADFILGVNESNGIGAEDEIEFMRRGWSNWLNSDQMPIRTAQWDRRFDLRSTAIKFSSFSGEDLSEAGSRIFRHVWAMLTSNEDWRSDVTEYLHDERLSASGNLISEIDRVERFAEPARHRAIALQHSCTYGHDVVEGDPESGRMSALMEELENQVDGGDLPSVPESALATLGRLDGPRWAEFIASEHEHLEEWWASRDPKPLRRALVELSRLILAEESKFSGGRRSILDIFADFTSSSGSYIAGGAVGGAVAISDGATPGNVAGGLAAGASTVLVTVLVTKGVGAARVKGLTRRLLENCKARGA